MLPKPLSPMEPKLIESPFDSSEYLFQVKWDGVRCLSYLEPTGVNLINKHLNHRTSQHQELAATTLLQWSTPRPGRRPGKLSGLVPNW
jgi:ATP-dependent DNA ligase